MASRARRHDDRSTTKLKKSIVLYYFFFFNANLISYDSQFLHDITVFTVKEKNSNGLIQRLDKLKFSRNEEACNNHTRCNNIVACRVFLVVSVTWGY